MSDRSYRPRETAVYRHFDRAGQLLYVGLTADPVRRTHQHFERAMWRRQIATITIEWFPSRGSASDEEERAIAVEGPLFNVLGRPEAEPYDEKEEMAKLERWLARPRSTTT